MIIRIFHWQLTEKIIEMVVIFQMKHYTGKYLSSIAIIHKSSEAVSHKKREKASGNLSKQQISKTKCKRFTCDLPGRVSIPSPDFSRSLAQVSTRRNSKS
jgi:hypothetical protein